MTTDHAQLDNFIAALNLDYKAEFVPFSQSRNKDNPKWQSLNWKVTVSKGSNKLTTDYSQGCAHAPAYTLPAFKFPSGKIDRWKTEQAVKAECETGKISKPSYSDNFVTSKHPIPAPPLRDVLYGLINDSDVIDYATFEDWADTTGYDKDSREAEKTYKLCLEIGLKLRAMLGDAILTELRNQFQDY